MKKIIVALFFIIIPMISFSQEEKATIEDIQFRLNFLVLGVEAEIGITKETTFLANIGGTPFLGWNDDGDGVISFIPFIDTQYRYYYNLKNRLEKGRSITKNSGNFIAIKGTYYFSEEALDNFDSDDDTNESDLISVGVVHGLQRAYQNFHLAFEGGLGYYETRNDGDHIVLPLLSFTIGYAF